MVVKFINEDRYGNLWAGTLRHGLARIDGQNGQVSRYVKDQSDQFNLQSNNMMAFCEDSSGLLWLGTNGGGFFQFRNPEETMFNYRYSVVDSNSLYSHSFS